MIVEIDGRSFNTDALTIVSHGHLVEIVETTHHLAALSVVEDGSLSDGEHVILVKKDQYEDQS